MRNLQAEIASQFGLTVAEMNAAGSRQAALAGELARGNDLAAQVARQFGLSLAEMNAACTRKAALAGQAGQSHDLAHHVASQFGLKAGDLSVPGGVTALTASPLATPKRHYAALGLAVHSSAAIEGVLVSRS